MLSLDLADNDINAEGAVHLTELLKASDAIVRLDVSNNPLGDEGCRELFKAMHKPNPDFAEDPGASKKDERYNSSLTYLDMSTTGLGHNACEELLDFFRCNKTMVSLVLEGNPGIQAKNMKHVFNSIRNYSQTFQRLQLSDNIVSLKSMGYLCRLLEETDLPLKHLEVSHCEMRSNHISYLSNSIMKSMHLEHLNMSSNPLGEEGPDSLAETLYIDHEMFTPKNETSSDLDMTEEEKLRSTFVDHFKVETYADLARDHVAEAKGGC